MHERHFRHLPSTEHERLGPRRTLVKRLGPRGLEIEGIGQHQPREWIDRARLHQFDDPALRVVAHPLVHLRPRGLRSAGEIDLAGGRVVPLLEQRGERRIERLAPLHPEPVGPLERDELSLGDLECAPQRLDGGSQLLAVVGHPQHAGDFRRRAAAGAGVGHGQCSPDARRREDHVAVTGRPHEVPGHLGDPLRDLGSGGGLRGANISGPAVGEGTRNQHGDDTQTLHGTLLQ